jgi:hypothetical protein
VVQIPPPQKQNIFLRAAKPCRFERGVGHPQRSKESAICESDSYEAFDMLPPSIVTTLKLRANSGA